MLQPGENNPSNGNITCLTKKTRPTSCFFLWLPAFFYYFFVFFFSKVGSRSALVLPKTSQHLKNEQRRAICFARLSLRMDVLRMLAPLLITLGRNISFLLTIFLQWKNNENRRCERNMSVLYRELYWKFRSNTTCTEAKSIKTMQNLPTKHRHLK